MATAEAKDNALLTGDERTERQKVGDEILDPIPRRHLARDVNRLSEKVDQIPRWKDIEEHGYHGRKTYEVRFDTIHELLRLSNVTPPVDHVIQAMKEYVESGRSYATCKGLRSFMYPGGDMTVVSADFGLDGNHQDGDIEKIEEEWNYPRMSARRVTAAIQEVRDGDYDVDVEAWSDSQKTTWRIIIDG